MGMIDTSFGVFCEALGSNSSLQVLDLRNNQISHDGAAELGVALKRNCTLRSLGLSIPVDLKKRLFRCDNNSSDNSSCDNNFTGLCRSTVE